MSLEKLARDISEVANELELAGQYKLASVLDHVHRTITAQEMGVQSSDMGMGQIHPEAMVGMMGGAPGGQSFADAINGAVQGRMGGVAAPLMPDMGAVPGMGAGMPGMEAGAPGAVSIDPQQAQQAVSTLKDMSLQFGNVKAVLLQGGWTLKDVNALQNKIDRALAYAESVVSGDVSIGEKKNGAPASQEEESEQLGEM